MTASTEAGAAGAARAAGAAGVGDIATASAIAAFAGVAGELTTAFSPQRSSRTKRRALASARPFAPLGMTRTQRASAAATARAAMTLIIAARYSAEPCR